MSKSPKAFDYYNYDALFSRGGVYNMVVGGRGLGKTFGAKEFVIRDAIKRGNQFIYLRRYQPEMSVKNTFFADIAYKFPEYEFRVNGMSAQMKNIGADNNTYKTIGHFAVLSKAQAVKSASYPTVKTIIFDEFILEKGYARYLPSEVDIFNGFYSTVDRNQDKTRVLFLANSVSIMNPYFIEYNIEPETEWVRKFEGFVIAHFPEAESFANQVKQTRYGKFIANTAYGDYAVGNKFADNHKFLIGSKTPEAKYYFTLDTRQGSMSVWLDQSVFPNVYYVTTKTPPDPNVWVMDIDLMREGKTLVQYSDKKLQYIRTAYGRANVKFDNPQLRNGFLRIFKR